MNVMGFGTGEVRVVGSNTDSVVGDYCCFDEQIGPCASKQYFDTPERVCCDQLCATIF